MLVSADWVLPVSSKPIADGAMVLAANRIVEVGTAHALEKAYPEIRRTHFDGAVISPGLVNAHTHLSLTALEGLLPPAEFHDWLAEVPAAVRALDRMDIGRSTTLGAYRCMQCGVTTVGDIAYGPEAPAAAADAGLAGTFFWEVLGVTAEELVDRLQSEDFPEHASASSCEGRIRCGISPHSPYTSGPGLLRATHALARSRDTGFAIHVAESPAEVELIDTGSGPLAGLASRLAHDFAPTGTTPVRYLDSLGVLDDAVAVHCVNVVSSDVRLLATKCRGVVLCPRSNEYLRAGRPPAVRLRAAGARIALGTDSTASNTDLDLFEDARALSRIAATIPAAELLEIMTLRGAEVLGLDQVVGSLEAGKQADFAVWDLPGSGDPVSRLVSQGSPARLRALMSSGSWRIRDGQPLFPLRNVELAVEHASGKAAEALSRARAARGGA